jgi:hypothetical protein
MTALLGRMVGMSVESARFAIAVLVTALLAGCGGSAGPAPSASAGRPTRQVSAASCAALSPWAQFAGARIVLIGTMVAGATAPFQNQDVLASPARVLVDRYLKGSGPKVLEVDTAVRIAPSGTQVAEDGIAPRAGQRWKIYTSSKRSPYQTSICAGSKRIH